MREKPAVLLDVSDFPAQQYGGLGAHIPVADFYLPTQRLDKSIEAAEKRCLARPALADQGNRVAGGNVDADIIERDNGAEAM